MAPFSCHNRVSYSPDLAAYLSCLSPFGPSPPSPLPVLQQAGDQAITPSCYHYSEAASDIFPVEIISTLNAGADSVSGSTTIPTLDGSSSCSPVSGRSTVSSGENKITSASSSSVDPRSQAALISKTQQYHSTQKRKDRQTSLSNSANSKDVRDVKSRKPNKRGGAPEEAEEQKAPSESPVAGYIHVRARPGAATDSHSLAERVRREKIREKMKTLQDLVPGCDKMVGKAHLLDEIIHYVQSLQNQVQFLSMKLASTDPFFHDVEGTLGFLDYLILQEELENISPGLPVVLGTGQTRPMASADEANEDPVHDASVLAGLLHEEGPPATATFHRSPLGGCTVWEPRPNA